MINSFSIETIENWKREKNIPLTSNNGNIINRNYVTHWKQYLMEQSDPTPVIPVRWKDLAKQGYEQTPGSKPLEKSVTLYDANITAVGNTVTAADMTVQKLLRDRKIFAWSQQGHIVHRELDNGNIESKYLSNTPL